MIKLTREQEGRRIELLNKTINGKLLNDKEQGESEFLYLLFKHQEQQRTTAELKKYINKLYSANKNIQAANRDKKGLSNYLIDTLAIENILQSNSYTLKSFFNNAYSYFKN